MSDVVIKVENLSKQYRLGVINHGTLAKDLQAWWAKKRGKEDPNSRINLVTPSHPSDLTLNPSPKGEGLENTPRSFRKGVGGKVGKGHGERSNELIYALRDINFEVRQGEVLGIIGSNGAGKSTLLKILSRVTSPTSGSIKIKGRIGSLLEVGTGFHPELTGRENIYLNGAILGMKRWEIDKKLDEIIDFSGVEKFIDTPVKRYSSGMYVRLAFAVAAHLDPEILVVDEVLAVGDAEFQKKCLGKMGDISSKEGRTVLFVSHNMGAVKTLCSKGLFISSGKSEYLGKVQDCISEYINTLKFTGKHNLLNCTKKIVTDDFYVKDIKISPERIVTKGILDFRIVVESNKQSPIDVSIAIKTIDRQPILQAYSWNAGKSWHLKKGDNRLCLHVGSLPLMPGNYLVNLWLGAKSNMLYWMEDVVKLEVEEEIFKDENDCENYTRKTNYPVLLDAEWRFD